jgi:site-specific recombinase XerD
MTDLTVPVARALLPEWRLALTAERKSPKTITLYLDSVGRYLTWVETQDLPPMRRTTLQTWITDMLCLGRSPSTARIRQQAVRRYAAWLLAVGHLDTAPFQGMKSPKLDQPVVEPLTVDQVRALLHTCRPDGATDPEQQRPLRHVRDEAIIRLMVETGIRLSEVIPLTAQDLNLDAGLITIQRGKGGRGRVIPVGPATAAAIRAYLARSSGMRTATSSGSANAAAGSLSTPSTALCVDAPNAPNASRGSDRTTFATRPPTAGSQRAAPNPA